MIHPTAVIEGSINAPPDIEIGPFTYVVGPVIFGLGVKISGHVVIGTPGEHKNLPPVGNIWIGDNVLLREFTIVHRGTGDRETRIGARCWIMDHGHIAHDCVLGDDVTLSPNVTLGGHTRVHTGATIGIGAMTHQHTTVGAYSMIGMGSVVTKDVPPFFTVAGNPARYLGPNHKGIERAGGPNYSELQRWEREFFADRRDGRKIIKIVDK